MARTPNRPAVIGLASTSSFAIRTLSFSVAISSRTGPTMRQGPHQVAQKSTSTGVSDLSTSCSKLWSFTTCGFAISVTPPLPPERQLLAHLFHCRFEAQNGFQAVQAGLRASGPGPQRAPLYEAPGSPSNEVP